MSLVLCNTYRNQQTNIEAAMEAPKVVSTDAESKPGNKVVSHTLKDFLNETAIGCSRTNWTDVVKNPVVKKLNSLGVTILPLDIPLDGKFGFVMFTEQANGSRDPAADNLTLDLSRKLYDDATECHCETLKDFERRYNESVDGNFFIQRCDEPKRLMIGFICYKRDGIVWYTARVGTLSSIWSPQQEKDKHGDTDRP